MKYRQALCLLAGALAVNASAGAADARLTNEFASNTPPTTQQTDRSLVVLRSGEVLLAQMISDPFQPNRWGVWTATLGDQGVRSDIIPVKETGLSPFGPLSIAYFKGRLLIGQEWRALNQFTGPVVCERYLLPAGNIVWDYGGIGGCGNVVATPEGVFSSGWSLQRVMDATGQLLPGQAAPDVNPVVYGFVPLHRTYRSASGHFFTDSIGEGLPLRWTISLIRPDGTTTADIYGDGEPRPVTEIRPNGSLIVVDVPPNQPGTRVLNRFDANGALVFRSNLDFTHVFEMCSAYGGMIAKATRIQTAAMLYWFGEDGSSRPFSATPALFTCDQGVLFAIRRDTSTRQLIRYREDGTEQWVRDLPQHALASEFGTLNAEHRIIAVSSWFSEPGSVRLVRRLQRFNPDGDLLSDHVLRVPEFPIQLSSFE